VGVDVRLARVYDPASNICPKACITYIIMTMPVANFLEADVTF
jgi:hypothetical protein